jgi:hypothetical protein
MPGLERCIRHCFQLRRRPLILLLRNFASVPLLREAWSAMSRCKMRDALCVMLVVIIFWIMKPAALSILPACHCVLLIGACNFLFVILWTWMVRTSRSVTETRPMDWKFHTSRVVL